LKGNSKTKIELHLKFEAQFLLYMEYEFLLYFQGLSRKARLSYNRTPTLAFREKYSHFSRSVQFADFVCKLRAVQYKNCTALFTTIGL